MHQKCKGDIKTLRETFENTDRWFHTLNGHIRHVKQRRWRRSSEGRHPSLIHTVESQQQDVMSHKMDARIKDGATVEKSGVLWFLALFFGEGFWFVCF